VNILEDMALDGLKHDKYRYSPSLEAFVWLIKDGKFNAESFEREYSNSFDFTIKVWGNMEGPRWKGFDEVTSRLNLPELLDCYTKSNFNFEEYRGDMKSNESVFKSKKGNCYDISEFIAHCLNKAGYKTSLLWVESGIPIGHIITSFKDKGKNFIIDNGKRVPKGIIGPYNSLRETGYNTQGIL
ncbi:MAG: hypothetical protein HQ538_07070, partial [Parcubacteria group bacterium]|nr:hypothetical protein [Parcubacteria group bacterium]